MSAPLYVVRGAPTPEELAAALVVLTARTAPQPAAVAPPPARSLWAAPVLRTPVVPGPGAWRASALPRSYG